MSTVWIIRKYQNDELIWEKTIPGNTSSKRVETILQRLVCMDLDADTVLTSSLNANARGRTNYLDRIGRGTLLIFGRDPSYSAEHKRFVDEPHSRSS